MIDNALYELINTQILAILADAQNKVRLRQAMRVLKHYKLYLTVRPKKAKNEFY